MMRRIEVAGSIVTTLITAEESDGRVGVIELETPPGPAPGAMHCHTREAWTAHILAGRIHIRFADEEKDLDAGAVIHVPPRRAFTWQNALGVPSRILFVYTPGGFERYFADVGDVFARNSGKALTELIPEILAVSEKYGIER
jgi:uncharacterized cupin superfamily protein